MKKNTKDVLTGLFCFGLYIFIGEFLLLIFLNLIGLKYNSLSLFTKSIVNLVYQSLLILVIFVANNKDIKDKFMDYKKKILKYISEYFKYWIIIIVSMIISNVIIYHITHIPTSTNQEAIMETMKKFPLYSTISAIIIAPILEELVFRLSFRKMIKNKYLFIVLSGFAFGLLHMLSAQSLLEFLYIIPYSIPGFIFAYTLVKSDNIFVPISLHMFHNTVLLIFQFIMLNI